MKKIFSVVAALLVMATVSAASYDKAVGIEVGGINGISYKQFVSDNCAIQCDLTVGLLQTCGSSMFMISGDKEIASEPSETIVFDAFDFKLNPNLVWQKTVANGLDIYAGGGVSLGMFHSGMKVMKEDPFGGKFGVNAMVGAEYIFAGTPIAIGIDFRPGYGLAFAPVGEIAGVKATSLVNYFDWGLGLSVRYLF